MPITIIAVGKQRETGLRLAADEYLKRLSRYCKISVVEVSDEKDPGDQGGRLTAQAMQAEGEKILGRVHPQDVVVALCVDAQQTDSVLFSGRIKNWHDTAAPVVFVIGGSMGLGDNVMKRANETMSMSNMTFPHQLARVMLMEQIYRAYKIFAGERYHK